MNNPSQRISQWMFFMMKYLCLLWMILCCTGIPCTGLAAVSDTQSEQPDEAAFTQGLAQLKLRDFQRIHTAVATIVHSGDPRAAEVLRLLLGSKLYLEKKTGQLVELRRKKGSQAWITPLFATPSLQPRQVRSRHIKRIGINNALRRQLKSALASLNLNAADPQQRIKAVSQLLGKLEPKMYQQLAQRIIKEPEANVRKLITLALAIYDLKHSNLNKDSNLSKDSNNAAIIRQAIDTISQSYRPQARNTLSAFINQTGDLRLKAIGQKALDKIEQRVTVAHGIQTLFFGLSLGSVLVLSAIGLAITFGVMGVINMAHGELMMLGAYTTYVIQTLMPQSIGLALLISIPVAFLVAGGIGIVIERSVIRFLYGRPLETLLATFGLSLILQQTVRTIFSPLNRSVATPEWMQGVIDINPLLSLTLNRLYIIGFCLLVFTLLSVVLRYTRLGIEVRAVSQNRPMARAMGIRSARVDALTFGLGSGIAGIAGVALSQLTNVGPNLGQSYIIDSFMVVVFGGVGNLWGTLVAGISLGIANKIIEPWAGAVLAKIVVLVFIILFIQKKPRGLFPQKGRSAEG
jgi:urea transport system permease protein